MKPLLLDLDGTLIDVSARHYGLYSELMAEQGLRPLSPDDYWRERRSGRSTMALLDATPAVDAELFTRAWMERIERPAWLALDRPYEGATEILKALRGGYELVLITLRRDRAALVDQLGMLRLAPYFEKVICPGLEPVKAKHLLRGVAALTPGGFAVGDTEADIALGSATGRRTVCLSHGVRSGAFLAGLGAGTIIGSLRELPEVIGAREASGWAGEVVGVDGFGVPRHVYSRAPF